MVRKEKLVKLHMLSIPEENVWILEEIKKLAKREAIPVNKLIVWALKEYWAKHKEGGSQTILAPTSTSFKNPVLEAARTNITDLEALIRANPGKTVRWILRIFHKQVGVRPETTKEYLKTLAILGLIHYKGSKVYPR